MAYIAPIVLFVYNRPWHTEQTLNALKTNDLADQSVLYIYADGPKKDATPEQLEKIKEVRNLIRKESWCKEVHIIESESNKGLADSIVAGVTEVVNRHGKIIVLEDDIVTSRGFLKYMNDALELYENEEKVMHISGYMYPHSENLPATFFFNVPLCWGWATWKRAWDFYNNDSLSLYKQIEEHDRWQEFNRFGGDYLGYQLKANLAGLLNTWFIKWHATTFLMDGLTLYPGKSLVQNIGFDNTGSHNAQTVSYQHDKLASEINVAGIKMEEDESAKNIILEFYKRELNKPQNFTRSKKSIITRAKRFLRKVLKKIFIKIYPNLYRLDNLPDPFRKSVINSVLGKHVKIYPPYLITDCIIGNYSYIGDNSIVNKTTIGKFTSIGPNCFCGWGVHPIDGISTSPMFYSTRKQNGMTLSERDKIVEQKRIYIGNDVFIGMNVTILDGVSIGDGAVIGAGSVVSKDIPDYAIAYGNPIQIHKYRFSEEQIIQFKKIKWWNYLEEKLPEIEKMFFDVPGFLEIELKK
ncbi:MAG: glycosyltransferase [Chitinophagaceae bacterium]|nr:glycosyltransferase [Chitinophagaceae bacterium]